MDDVIDVPSASQDRTLTGRGWDIPLEASHGISPGRLKGASPRNSLIHPEASSAVPGTACFSSVQWEDSEDIVTAGNDRTSKSNVVNALALIPRSPAPWEEDIAELQDDVASLEARFAASEAPLRHEVNLYLKAERLCNQASQEWNAALDNLRRLDKSLAATHKVVHRDRGWHHVIRHTASPAPWVVQCDRQRSDSGEASPVSVSTVPAAFTTFLEEVGALQLVIPAQPATSGSSRASTPATPPSLGTPSGAAAMSGSSTTSPVDSDSPDESDLIVPSAPHKGKGERPAKPSAKPQPSLPPPKNKQPLGRPSVVLKARKAADMKWVEIQKPRAAVIKERRRSVVLEFVCGCCGGKRPHPCDMGVDWGET
ncbi:unnamed protein product [Phytophthora fragariaefolia]|uniref:Unnamed protein product n=1 Tax=Phytophthora fragariaefolia TaxID=1490495 RepID=A0A9W6XGG6_9STRA|nr:unnamed protein product [Phytophthora fragariaefolia]